MINFIKRIRANRDKCAMGWIPDRFDDRDFTYGGITARKSIVDLSYLLPSPKNWLYQGSLGSCVAHGIGNQVYAEERRRGFSRAGVPISRLYLYYYARWLEYNLPPKSQGAYPRLAYKALIKVGCPTEKVWRYKTSTYAANCKPSSKARRYAMARKNLRYKRVPRNADSIRSALSAGKLVTIGTQVTKKMQNYRTGSGEILYAPQKGEQLLGGHLMCLFGYEKNHFLTANSWRGREIILLDESWIEAAISGDYYVISTDKKAVYLRGER